MKFRLFAILTALTLTMAGAVYAEDAMMKKDDATNKFCPVSGEKVGEMGKPYVVEYKGKKYNLCCEMCQADFMKDPEAAIKKMEAKEAQEAAAPAGHDHTHK